MIRCIASILLGVILVAITLLSPVHAASVEETTLSPYLNLVQQQFDRYPEMQVDDLYKLIYQATRGPGHYGMDYDGVLNYLMLETDLLDSTRYQDTLLVEPIGPEYIRLYLGPFVQRGGSLAELADAQVRSAEESPDPALLPRVWNLLLCSPEFLQISPFDSTRLSEFTDLVNSNEWPAVHHSDKYRTWYDPHYRVLRKSASLKILEKLPK